jgi:hypothetical protein
VVVVVVVVVVTRDGEDSVVMAVALTVSEAGRVKVVVMIAIVGREVMVVHLYTVFTVEVVMVEGSMIEAGRVGRVIMVLTV